MHYKYEADREVQRSPVMKGLNWDHADARHEMRSLHFTWWLVGGEFSPSPLPCET